MEEPLKKLLGVSQQANSVGLIGNQTVMFEIHSRLIQVDQTGSKRRFRGWLTAV